MSAAGPGLVSVSYEERLARVIEAERIRREAKKYLDEEEQPRVWLPPPSTLRERLARPARPAPFRITGWWPAGGRVMLTAQYQERKDVGHRQHHSLPGRWCPVLGRGARHAGAGLGGAGGHRDAFAGRGEGRHQP